MIDGRGQVLITDFGLAVFSGQLDRAHIRDGTPAYMAPEQLAGKEVSVQSDIYALGLVLHEMFTGKHAFKDGVERTTPASLSSLVKDIDPAVERAIIRCLDSDPSERPSSALAVAAARPGGDPVAAALAAGETPTPAMVAASDAEGISIRTAWICLATILVSLAGVIAVAPKQFVFEKIPFAKSTAVLDQKARDLVQSFGCAEPPVDTAHGFSYEQRLHDYAEKRQWQFPGYQAILSKGAPAILYFWYRQSPRNLETMRGGILWDDGLVKIGDPAPTLPGMVRLRLDTEGRLCWFEAAPPEFEESHDPERPPDWTPLLNAAGLDTTRFQPADPHWIPANPFDARAAWTGSYAYAPEVPIRVEAASWRGRPVSFLIAPPWIKPGSGARSPQSFGYVATGAIELILFLVAVLLAWRNLSLGRSDRSGAVRLAGFYFASSMLSWLVRPQHASSIVAFVADLFGNISSSLFMGVLAAAAYVALEPHVRRRWPKSMVTWSRWLSGRIRDPLVGAHMLIGIAVGASLSLLIGLAAYFRGAGYLSLGANALYMFDASGIANSVFYSFRIGVTAALVTFFLLFLLRALLRREWLAAAVVLAVAELHQNNGNSWETRVIVAIVFSSLLVTAIRFGFLATASTLVIAAFTDFLLTYDFSLWYASSTIAGLFIMLGLTAYAFHTAVANRKLFDPDFRAPD